MEMGAGLGMERMMGRVIECMIGDTYPIHLFDLLFPECSGDRSTGVLDSRSGLH